MRTLFFVIFCLCMLLPKTASAQCSAPVGEPDLLYLVESATEAFLVGTPSVFADQAEDLQSNVSCMKEPIKPDLASKIHLIRGLSLYAADKGPRAALSFAAARRAGLGPSLPVRLSGDHPLHELYTLHDVGSVRCKRLHAPARGELRIDGEPSLDLPRDWPSVVQVFDDSGQLRKSAVVHTSSDLPRYVAKGRWKRRTPALIASGVTLLASGGFLIASARQHRMFYTDWENEEDRPFEDMNTWLAYPARTNRLYLTSVGLAGLGITGVGMSFLIR